jgi:predicted AlkP superfamily pyrophosphatase or phosphodiesterase
MGRSFSTVVLLCTAVFASRASAQAAAPLVHTPAALANVSAVLPAVPAALTRNVIVVSIDGLRPDAITEGDARTLTRLLAEGSGTLDARTIMPSRTLPSHTSMLTGVVPETHGITWNSDQTEELGVVMVPTVFELAHRAGYRTAAFFSKKKFNHILRDGTLDKSRVPKFGVLPATKTVNEAIQYMRRSKPNLLFVHIAEPDFMGHRMGWMSIGYRWGVREADAGVAALLRAANRTYGEGNFTFIVTADHGGNGRTHGTEDLHDTTIPWISWGQGVRESHRIAADVRTMDTAATVLRVLGIAVPTGWDGVPVAEALAVTALSATPPGGTSTP